MVGCTLKAAGNKDKHLGGVMSGHAEALTLFNRKDYPPKLIVSRTPQSFKAECAEVLQRQEQDRVQRDPELMRQLGQTTLTDIINQPEL